jgi:REP element-mobilizing transposase RayT
MPSYKTVLVQGRRTDRAKRYPSPPGGFRPAASTHPTALWCFATTAASVFSPGRTTGSSLGHLADLSGKFGCSVHAYVLMTNHVHVHLLLTPAKADSASLLLKHWGQRYVQYVNRTYRRSGILWEGRFRSCVTQEEDYVLAYYRYIEFKPVRTQMVTHPRHTAGRAIGPTPKGSRRS